MACRSSLRLRRITLIVALTTEKAFAYEWDIYGAWAAR